MYWKWKDNKWIRRQRGEMKKTLLGCIAIITAGVFLNSDYSILLKILGIILIVIVTKMFDKNGII
jgi:hypothetical protein